jgi:hypothetical protein
MNEDPKVFKRWIIGLLVVVSIVDLLGNTG